MKFIDPASLPEKVDYTAHFWITLPDNTRLAASLWIPFSSEKTPVPALLEYNTDCRRHGGHYTDELNHPYLAANRYACIRVDPRGIGDSDGLPQDPHAAIHVTDAVAVIEWIAKQPWCSGAVGMFGLLWGASTALRVAAQHPPALKAIVSVAGTDDPYLHGTHYQGGVLIPELALRNVDVRPADPAIVKENWKEHWIARLKATEDSIHQPLIHTLRDEYWKSISLRETPSAITVPILFFTGWHDPHVNAALHMFNHFKAPMKCVIGPWGPQYPHIAMPRPNIGFLQEMLSWFGCFLKKESNAAEALPNIRFYMMDGYSPDEADEHRKGCWYEDIAWPPEQYTQDTFYLSSKELCSEKQHDEPDINLNSPLETGLQQGDFCIEFPDQPFPRDQTADDKRSYTIDTVVFKEPYLITGAPIFTCEFKTSQSHPQLHVRLCDVSEENKSTLITSGVIELNHDETHEHRTELNPELFYTTNIALRAIAYIIPSGHKLRISISTRLWPIFLPSPVPEYITIKHCSVNIPRPSRPLQILKKPFEKAVATKPSKDEILVYPEVEYRLIDQGGDHEVVQLKNLNYGKSKNTEHGLLVAYNELIKNSVCKSGTVSEYSKRINAQISRTDHNAKLEVRTGLIRYPDRVCLRTFINAKLNYKEIYNNEWSHELIRASAEPADNIDSHPELKHYMRYASKKFKEQNIKVKCVQQQDEVPVIVHFDRHAQGGPLFTYIMGENISTWFPAFLAEFQYIEQWIEKFEPYMNLDKHSDLMLWVDGIKEMKKEEVHAAIEAYMKVNQDVAIRMLKAIEKYELPLDLIYITQKANSLVYSYHYIERYRQWPSNEKLPLMIPEIMEQMPETMILDLNSIDEQIMALYVKYFPPESKTVNNNHLSYKPL